METVELDLPAVVAGFSKQEPARTIKDINADIVALKQRQTSDYQRSLSLTKDLSDLESVTRDSINLAHQTFAKAIRSEIAILTAELALATYDLNYKRIDMAFLSMRKTSKRLGQPVPMFSVFCPFKHDSSRCTLWASARVFHRESGTSIPYQLAHYFHLPAMEAHARKIIGWKIWQQVTVSLTARFTGVIPAEIKAKMDKSQKIFDEIVIVTEAPDWEMTTRCEVIPLVKRDPLVIGRKGDHFWLIDIFDVTPMEEYVSKEFTN